MTKIYLAFTLFFLTLVNTPLVLAAPLSSGIIMHNVRLIYPETALNGVSIAVENLTESNFLVQSWTRPYTQNDTDEQHEEHGGKNEFIILPLLTRFNHGEKLNLLVKRIGGTLPENKESVFYASMKFIPSLPPNEESTKTRNINVILINNIKVFYRPASVPKIDTAENSKKIGLSLNGKNIVVNNPTPYFITFHSLMAGNIPIDKAQLKKMVPPLGSQTYVLSHEPTSKEVKFSVINDIGTASHELIQLSQ